ncbi:formate/nitrite transporter family protein [Halarchaeum sp. CBA1220]|uniref:formate/nitrite transporter family protein n=1 Tax=Halarchaeum sp. CBA1220 TaxID=1853682 RepID=UPI000F3A93EE|nr:formate/nitrite transporter family protein [Halarchaeum sp. CBA1220]QLC33313.1 formate/nitrite transporter family protein [Halarchaeum sp. CBA1220]
MTDAADPSLDAEDAAESGPSGTDILARQIRSGLNELRRPASGLLLSGLSAGLDIAFGPLFMGVVLTLTAGVYEHATRTFLVANAYAIGFVFVVLGRSELFTEHTTLAVLPVIDGRSSLASLARLWGLVYAGNVVGASVFAVAMVWFAPAYGVVDAGVLAALAAPLLAHDLPVLFAGAVLAGWLMGLLSWLVAGADSTLARFAVVWLVTAAIGLAHLPHSIAGTVEVLAGVLTSDAYSLLDYVRFLVVATAGNAAGGVVFVALLKYGHVVRGSE